MAKGDLEVKVDIMSDLHSLVGIYCLAGNCKYHQKNSMNCNLKQIVVGVGGHCTSYFVEEGKGQKKYE